MLAEFVSPSTIKMLDEIGIRPITVVLLIVIWWLIRYINSKDKLHAESVTEVNKALGNVFDIVHGTNEGVAAMTKLVELLANNAMRYGNGREGHHVVFKKD